MYLVEIPYKKFYLYLGLICLLETRGPIYKISYDNLTIILR